MKHTRLGAAVAGATVALTGLLAAGGWSAAAHDGHEGHGTPPPEPVTAEDRRPKTLEEVRRHVNPDNLPNINVEQVGPDEFRVTVEHRAPADWPLLPPPAGGYEDPDAQADRLNAGRSAS